MRNFVIASILVSLVLLPDASAVTADAAKETRGPQVLSSVAPEYTAEGRAAGIKGVVELKLEIDAQGRLKSAVVEKGLPYGLNDAAAKCVQRWTFAPALVDGKPAASSMLVKVEFRLPAKSD
jgi:TonB family protein